MLRSPIPSPSLKTFGAAVLLTGSMVLAGACGPENPEDRVAGLRAQYEAELISFSVREVALEDEMGAADIDDLDPTVDPEGAEAAEPIDDPDPVGGDAASADPDGDGIEEEDLIAEPVPVQQNAWLDIQIDHSGRESLDGLTLDISQNGTDGQEKDHWRAYVETDQLVRGVGGQISHVLEDVDYEEGDGFHVEVRRSVPAGERGEYREFGGAGGSDG